VGFAAIVVISPPAASRLRAIGISIVVAAIAPSVIVPGGRVYDIHVRTVGLPRTGNLRSKPARPYK
jgi:hypothetical protein